MKTTLLLACGSLWSFILVLPSAQAIAADGWGASWSFGPVHPTTTNHIIYTKTTMVPGRLPVSYWSSSSVGPLFLWPGMSNPTSDLVQTTMDAWSGSTNSSYCRGNGSQWCVEASVFGSFGQRNGPTVAIDPDDHVTIEYRLGSDNNTWTQTVTSQKLGKVVSTLTSTSGLMLGGGFGFATEADADSFTVDTAYYLCTEIHLAAADPAFGATGAGGVGANHGATGTGSGIGTAKNLRTPDNGLTWLVDLITLPAMNPQGTQTPSPTYNCSGSGGSGGSGGSTGSGGNIGSGGSGGSARVDGGAGPGGSTRSDGSVSSGGSIGRGGTVVAGMTGTNGGVVGSGGSVAAGSGGVTGEGGLKGTAGANEGSGGSVVAVSGGISSGGTGTGGTTGPSSTGGSAGTTVGSSGCGCVVGSRSPRGGMSTLLLLGALTLLARRRRNRT